MAIQMRRGAFTDFDPTRMLPGEWAVMLSDDENTADGFAVYICYAAGTVKRLVSSDELTALLDNIYADVENYVDDAFDVDEIRQAATDALRAANEAQAAIEAIGDISQLAVPLMSSTTRGGAKLGNGLIITNGALTVDPTAIEFPTMSAALRGIAKLGSGLSVSEDALSVEAISDTQIDDVMAYDPAVDEEPVTGDESLSVTGLAYFWDKLKTWASSTFAALAHTHAASDVTSGTFAEARIPSLSASKITSGTLDAARVPTLDAAKIGTGTLDAARIPSLDASKIASGTLPVARGGTGLSASPSMLTDLASTSAADVMSASPRPGVTGTLPIANGGTGATSAADGRYNLMQGIAETSSSPSDAARLLFTRGDGSTPSDVFYTRPFSTVKTALGFDSGLLDLAGRTAYPLYVYSSLPAESSLPVTPCFVLDTSDYGLYYCDGQ